MTSKDKKSSNISVNKIIASPYFEVRPAIGGVKIIVIGAVGISEVSESEVMVKCHGMKLRISGAGILINVLEHNLLEVVGRVEDIKIVNA